jgi:hypothetical protein
LPLNPHNQKDLTKLMDARRWSTARMEPFRRKNYVGIRELVGYNYSEDGTGDRVPVNLLELAINIYMRQLSAGTPTPSITSPRRELMPIAADFELAMMQATNDYPIKDTIQECVLNALFTVGIVKCGEDRDGFFCIPVNLDDWVVDMSARRWEDRVFCGNKYRRFAEEVEQDKSLVKDARQHVIMAGDSSNTNETTGDEDSVASLSGVDNALSETGEPRKRVTLWDLYLVQERKVITVSEDWSTGPLKVVDWDMWEEGPFFQLGYGKVPNNIIPLAPRTIMMDLHLLINALFRKMGRQAERQKTTTGYRGQAADDAKRIVDASDGEAILMDNPEGVRQFVNPGVDPTTLAFSIQIKDLFTYLNGNLDALGGLSPQSGTLGQDELLRSAANQRIADMQERTVDFASKILNAMAYKEWHDPATDREVFKRIPGTDQGIVVNFDAKRRKGAEFSDFTVKAIPQSLTHTTPATKLQAIGNVFDRFIAPYIPMYEQNGLTIDFMGLIDVIARLGNLPELDGLVKQSVTPIMPEGEDTKAKKSPVTKRSYERINRPGATQGSKDAVAVKALMGVKSQASEMAQIGRSNG